MKENCRYCGGSHKDQEHYLTKKPYNETSGMTRGTKSKALKKAMNKFKKNSLKPEKPRRSMKSYSEQAAREAKKNHVEDFM
jgi:hypothetical protein